MSEERYVVMILPDNDYDLGPFSDVQSLIDETTQKINDGEWAVYGVGLGLETAAIGDIEPDYGTFVWGVVTDAGHDGTYLGVDKIKHEYLRDEAQNQVAVYGEARHRV